uniref:Uncharacterized protein n=1 Tax=Rhizophora mucronata TaxID=61149 RepID=A0A2P2JGP1_RHIMU
MVHNRCALQNVTDIREHWMSSIKSYARKDLEDCGEGQMQV